MKQTEELSKSNGGANLPNQQLPPSPILGKSAPAKSSEPQPFDVFPLL
jgi:hypothetical protein